MSVKTSRLSSHLKTSRFAPSADFLILSDTFACMQILSMVLSHLSCVIALLLPPHCHIKPTVSHCPVRPCSLMFQVEPPPLPALPDFPLPERQKPPTSPQHWPQPLRRALEHCLSNSLAFVTAPKRSGKTELVAEIATQFARRSSQFADGSQQRVVLCCADTQQGELLCFSMQRCHFE